MHWIYLIVAVLSEVLGTISLKYSENFTRLYPSLFVALGYGTSFFFLSLTLKTISVSISYSIWSGLGIVLITVIGAIYFNEKPDLPALIGIFLILSGILVIQLFSSSIKEGVK